MGLSQNNFSKLKILIAFTSQHVFLPNIPIMNLNVSEQKKKRIKELLQNAAFKDSMLRILKSLSGLLRAQQTRIVFLHPDSHDKFTVLSTLNTPLPEQERHLIQTVCDTRLFSNVHAGSDICGKEGVSLGRIGYPVMTVPLLIGGESFGVLQMMDKMAGENFSEHDLHLAQASTGLFSRFVLDLDWQHDASSDLQRIIYSVHRLLFENLFLYKENLENHHLLGEVIRVSKLINTTIHLQHLLEAIMTSAKLVLRTESCSLMLLDENTGDLYFNIITGSERDAGSTLLKEVRIPKGQGIAGYVAETRKALIVNDPPSDPRWFQGADKKSSFTTRNILAVPLHVRNRLIGVLEVINALGRDSFNERDLELFNSFSELAALAIYNRELIDSLKETNKKLERRVEDLSSLHEVSKTLIATVDEQDFFQEIVKILSKVHAVQRSFIALYNEEQDILEVISYNSSHVPAAKILLPLEGSVSGQCFRENKIINSNNLEHDFEAYSDVGLVLKKNCILYPLSHGEESYGVVAISQKREGVDFDEEDIQLLSTIGGQIIKGIQNFRLWEDMLEKREYDKELEVTSSIQREILPSTKLNSPYFDMGVVSIPAKLMGGDFYDYYALDDSTFTFTIADVSGKSLPASLFMAVTSSILRTISREYPAPSEIFRRSNELIFQDSRSAMFVTVFQLLYNAQKQTVRFSSAGHNELFLYRARTGELEFYKTKGIPLGILSSAEYGNFLESEFSVQPHDVILLFTDGVTEAINKEKEEYGEERLGALLKKVHSFSAEQIIDKIHQEVNRFCGLEPQFDDFTLFVIKILDTANNLHKESRKYIEKSFSVSISELLNVKSFVEATLGKWKVEEACIRDIVLCCDEAITNIVTHAYVGVEEKKSYDRFFIWLEMTDKELKVTIIDKGNAFDYTSIPVPDISLNLKGERVGGFGVFLIRSLMDEVKYSRKEEQNFLLMTKHR